METNEKILSDFHFIDVFRRGGMLVAAENMLTQVYEDYRAFHDKTHREAMIYLKYVLLPKIRLASDIGGLKLIPRMEAPTWNDWLSNFPNCSVEAMEDKQGGRSMQLSTAKLDLVTKEEFYNDKTGLFYTPNGFNEKIREGMKRRREQGNVKSINALFVDIDGGDKESQIELISGFPILPSFVVETKNGYHVLWKLREGYDQEDVGRWVGIQKGLIERFDSDKACSDVSRLLRMPSSWHCKGLWKGEDGFFVELVLANEKVYSLDDFKVFEKKIVKRTVVLGPGEVVVPNVTALLPGDRHAGLKDEVARAYARIGTSRELAPKVRGEMKTWYQASCIDLKPHWEKEVDDYCDWVTLNQFGTKL